MSANKSMGRKKATERVASSLNWKGTLVSTNEFAF